MARPLRGVSQRLLFIAAGAAAVATPPLLLRAEPDNWPLVQEAVKNMSPSERDRLDRNTREYLALSESERQKYRDLHMALAADIQGGNERLATTMQDYYAWLATNQAYDRERVTAISDPAERVAEIARIVDKRSQAASRSRFWVSRVLLKDVPELKPDELKVLMAGIEARLQLTDKESELLLDEKGVEKQGVARYFALFKVLLGQRQNVEQLLNRWDAEELVDSAGITMPPSFEMAAPEHRRVMVLRMIIGNVRREYELAVIRTPPTSTDLEKVVTDWSQDPAEQQRLLEKLEMEPSDFRRELEQTYAKDKISLDARDLREMAPGLFDRGYYGSRGRGGPEDGARGADRRPFFPPGDRPNPERRDGRPPIGPRNGDRPGPEDAGGPRPGDRPPGDRPPQGPPPDGPRPGDERPPPRP